MGKIHILTPEIISKIAAGEVIERPASVVKELMENALDANTASIELNLKEAGKTLIHIKDTGRGIEPDDIEKVFIRHSTSKINTMGDLFNLNSLGFRGEALYSIASVSDTTLLSKTESADSGWEIHCRGNEKISLKPVGLVCGTEIKIKELFFNTPARKKFLKSDTSELNHIMDMFISYAILYPKIRFSLSNNLKSLIELIPEDSFVNRISKALNLEKKDLLEAKRQCQEKNIAIHLILGDINIQRAGKSLQFIFVNGRPVQNRSLNFHINQIYRLIMPQKVYPFFAVYLNLSPSDIDVNVHPSKREVKIKDEHFLISALRSLCEHTLMSLGKAKQIRSFPAGLKLCTEYPETKPAAPAVIKDKPINEYILPDRENFELFNNQNRTASQTPEASFNASLSNKLAESFFLGTFHGKYLIFCANTSLLIIDTHAAHERIGYEKLLKQIEKDKIEIQNLLTPVLLGLVHQEMLVWEESRDRIEKIGFITTLWDNTTIAIHSHPVLINNPERAIRNIIEEDVLHLDTAALARRACRQAIMSGTQIKKEEAEYLKNSLLKCLTPFTCPHGRPTVIEIQEKFLNKQFLRS